MRIFKHFLSVFIVLTSLVISSSAYAQEDHKEIEWLSFEEAMKKNEKEPKIILIDFYTDWCGWCKKMDKATYENPAIAAYISKNFYAIKFDAEQKAPINFEGKEYTNRGPQAGRRGKGTHDLAISLLNGKMSYPTTLFMTSSMEIITPIPGYQDAKAFEPIMKFMIEGGGFSQEDWTSFVNNFQSSL